MDHQRSLDGVIAAVVSVANRILQGEEEAYSGARRLWQMQTALSMLEQDLLVFVGLASEWEDSPQHRSALERDIVVEADRLRARWGP